MKRRVLAALLALAMLLALVPSAALAATVESTIQPEYGIYVNPLWADENTSLHIIPPLQAAADAAPEYLTEADDVITEIRSQFQARATSFSIYYKTSEALEMSDLEGYVDAAMAHTGVPTEGDYLKWSMQFCSYGYSGSSNGTTHRYQFTFNVGYHDTAAQEAQVDAAVAQLRAELALNQLSGYQSVKAVYDWLCSNVTYDYGEDSSTYPLRHSAYAAFISRHCVCQGYSLAIYRLLLEEGIDCRIISGDSNGDGAVDHGWNIVKLDGKYYNLDATWDAGNSSYSWFLRSPDNFSQHDREAVYDTADFHAAYPMAEENYTFNPTIVDEGPCGSNLYWTLDEEGTLTITGTGDMEKSTWRSSGLSNIKQIIISEGITSICDYAFSYLYCAYRVSIPSSVRSIGDYAFEGCSSLPYVTVPQGVTAIGSNAFVSCTKMTGVQLPESLTKIGVSAFSNCSRLSEITIPANVTVIEDTAFYNCPSLTDIWFEGSAPAIGTDAFKYDTATAHYPAGDATWNGDVLANYGGTITWSANHCLDGHTPVTDEAVAATCIATGLTEGSHCSACGEILVPQEETPLADHTVVIDPYVAPTCTEPGYFEGRHCGICDEVLIEQLEISALGHQWSGWSVTLDPTSTAPGEEARSCGRCGDTETREIPATGEPVTPPEEEEPTTAPTEEPTVPPAEEPTVPPVTDDPVTPPVEDTPAQNPFVDIVTADFYYDPVLWAVDENITNGIDDTHFGPQENCTRAHVVTFLWRAADCPAPTSSYNPFVDVDPGAYYYDAVLWAVEQGITNGLTSTTFAPDQTCTRGQIVTFLWRAEGEPAPTSTQSPFTDVPAGQWYTDAILWAVENGITKGMGEGTFAPDEPCTRGQIVTFLYRAMGH